MDKAECPQKGDTFIGLILFIFSSIGDFVNAIITSFFDSWSIRVDTFEDLFDYSGDVF